MGEITGIEWTDASWNPWYGCHKVSQGCKNCYMFREQKQYGRDPNVVQRSKTRFDDPLRWEKAMTATGAPPARETRRVFTCSWSDFFIEEADVWRDGAWEIIRKTPHLIYQILTKRAESIHDCLPDDWQDGYPNVWLGASVENNKELWRLEYLCEIPARVRFVSYEPALEPVDFSAYSSAIHWIICGGESGPGCRPFHPDWARSVRADCRKYGIAFFMKQLGGHPDKHHRLDQLPDDLQVREFPELK